MVSGVPPEPWVLAVFKDVLSIEDKKPGVVARSLFSHIKTMQPSPPPPCHEFQVLSFIFHFIVNPGN